MGWFLRLMEELAIECRVGHPTAIRKAETRRQKHDRRDAALLLQLLAEDRFPAIWMPSTEYRDLRSLLLHRHQWVRMRTHVQNGCTRSCWPTACGAARRCGIVTARRCLRPCRCRRTRGSPQRAAGVVSALAGAHRSTRRPSRARGASAAA